MQTIELELSEEQLRQMRVLGFETVEAFLEHMATHPIVPNPEKPKRKRKAVGEPRKRSITEKTRKVRTRKSKQVVENFHGYTTKKLAELVEQPYTDTGLEVNQEAAREEYYRRLDAMSEDMIAEFIAEPKAYVAGSIGFDWQDDADAAPVVIVEAVKPEPSPAPLLLTIIPPPIRPDMIRKPMPPAAPTDFEWILPPVPKAPVRTGLFSRVWSALKKIA